MASDPDVILGPAVAGLQVGTDLTRTVPLALAPPGQQITTASEEP